MRHELQLPTLIPVHLLTIGVVAAADQASLVPLTGAPELLTSRVAPARIRAVPMASVTGTAQQES